jgi:acyl transferase domain-containing protein
MKLAYSAVSTATGDPIEIGAAAEVLMPAVTMPGLNRLPLALASSKSFLGHSEPAAGVVGMLHAAHMLRHAMLPPIAHLVQLNPYVEAAVAATRGQWNMPRQTAGLVAVAASAAMSPEQQALRNVGTSAFAFQGGLLHKHMYLCFSLTNAI